MTESAHSVTESAHRTAPGSSGGDATRAHPRLSLNQATIKHASLPLALRLTTDAGIRSIGLWREPVADVGLGDAVSRLRDSGLRFSSYCRGGFFTAPDGEARRRAIDDNRRAIEETASLAAAGADGSSAVLVLVAGPIPEDSRDLVGARSRVRDAIAELAPDAVAAGVTLGLEPLHPMFAADRAVISTLGQALDIVEEFSAAAAGVIVDSYHIWWDPQVLAQIARAGRGGRIASYQVSDWVTPLPADLLLGRGQPGDGHIDFGPMTQAVTAAGYAGDVEVEIFNDQIWNAPYSETVTRTIESVAAHVAPHLLGSPE